MNSRDPNWRQHLQQGDVVLYNGDGRPYIIQSIDGDNVTILCQSGEDDDTEPVIVSRNELG